MITCMWFFSYCFQVSLSLISINWLWHVCVCIALHLSYLEFVELLENMGRYYCFLKIKFGAFWSFFGASVLSALLSLLLELPLCKWWYTWWCPMCLQGSVHFSSLFFLFILLTRKSQFNFRSVDIFFCKLKFTVESL